MFCFWLGLRVLNLADHTPLFSTRSVKLSYSYRIVS